jgi:putative oxidoreductase
MITQKTMKVLKHIPAAILAFLFLFGGVNYFFPMIPAVKITGNQFTFFNLLTSTGYMAVVKIVEIVGGILMIMPTKRALAVIILAPVSVNILLFEVCIVGTPGIGIVLIALIATVIYQEKQKFMALL